MTGTRSIDLHWLAPHADHRAALSAIKAALPTDPLAAATGLVDLANHRLDFMATLQTDRAAASLFADGRHGWPEIRLALLGSSTVDPLLPAIRVAGVRRRLQITPFVGGFAQYRQDLLLASSELHRFKPDAILLAPGVNDLLDALPLGAADGQADAAIAQAVQSLVELWRVARGQFAATVVQQSFLHTGHPIFGSLDALVPASPLALVERLNRAVGAAAAAEGVLLLDLQPFVSSHGRDAWFDPTRWFHAKQLIAPTAAVFYGDLLVRLLAAARGQSAKCLVLDLDNTLWGGVIGDDGMDGIVLGQGNPLGEAFVAFQHYVRQLGQRGVILAVCSKNNPEIAEEAFRSHPDMVLKREDIAVFVANWQDKPSNLREIAQRLNIGIDSLVFFDDNPAERAIVRRTLPEVAVPEVPEDPSFYVSCLAEAGYFEAVAFTAEDQARGQQYLANEQRSQILAGATDMEGFLASLDMRMIVAAFNDVDLPRVAQLTGKTNQFNLTTRRHSQDQMAAFAADPGAVTLSFRLTDKFGDNGLISVLVALPDGGSPELGAPDRLRIDTWLMSCRVLGRQVEEAVIDQLCRIARERGFRTIVGEYIPTAKNGMVSELYPRLGFAPATAGAADGAICWSLTVAEYQAPKIVMAIELRDAAAGKSAAAQSAAAE